MIRVSLYRHDLNNEMPHFHIHSPYRREKEKKKRFDELEISHSGRKSNIHFVYVYVCRVRLLCNDTRRRRSRRCKMRNFLNNFSPLWCFLCSSHFIFFFSVTKLKHTNVCENLFFSHLLPLSPLSCFNALPLFFFEKKRNRFDNFSSDLFFSCTRFWTEEKHRGQMNNNRRRRRIHNLNFQSEFKISQ